jgi:PEP-CTERM motif-containing protein
MTTSKKFALVSTFTTLLSLVALARPSVAQSYNAAGDFSAISNPNNAWSYGWSFGVGGAFNLDTLSTNNWSGVGLNGWLGDPASNDGHPLSLKNQTASPITISFTTIQPGQLAIEGGESNRIDIVRWTAPFSGTFSINATFTGLSALGDSSDVHILHNGISLLSSNVTGSPSPVNYSAPQSVLVGDTIDFIIGNGGNGANEDFTGLSATIVPEPGTLGLVGMGLACLLSFRFWKRK